MIMHNGKQVGFIQHENNNIDKVMHNGNCVFEQGYPRDNNTITGDIVLDGTIGKSLKSWSITGNTVQDGTPSPDNPVEIQSVGERTKNLFDKNDATVQGYIDKSGSVRSTVSSNQWFTLANFIECSGIISISAQNGLGSTAHVACYDENKTFLGTVLMSSDNSTTATLTLLDGTVYIKACSRDNSLDTFMLNLGDTPLPYEPYGYKIPVVNSGKNLFNTNATRYEFAVGSDGKLVDYPGGYLFIIPVVKDSKKYTLSVKSDVNITVTRLGFYDKPVPVDGELISNMVELLTTKNPTITSYNNDNLPYVVVQIGSTFVNAYGLDSVYLTMNDTVAGYEPYREPITTPIYLSEPLQIGETLNSDGTRDVKWKKLVLTGKEAFSKNDNDSSSYLYYYPIGNINKNIQGYCSHLKRSAAAPTHIIGFNTTSEYSVIYFNFGADIMNAQPSGNTVAGFKEYLKSQYDAGTPVTVYYQPKKPTTETIEVPQIPTFRNTPTIRGIMTSLSVDTTIKPTATNVSFRSTNKYQRFISRYIDFDNNKMSTISGDFSNIRAFTNRRRCNVLDDGTISAFYGDDNYVEDGSNGQVMVYQPKFYYKVEPIRLEPITDSIGYHIREAIYSVSDIPLSGYKLHPAFINEAGNEVDYFCLSAFEGCAYDVSNSAYITNDSQTVDFTANTGDKLSSIANVKPMSGLTQQLTRPNSEIIAKNRGAGWHTYGIKQASVNQMLMFIEYGNLQSNISSGVVSITDNASYNCSSYTGSTSSLGNTTGRATSTINEIGGTKTTYTDNGKTSISYRGMENPYGNMWDFVYGVNIHGDGTHRGGIPYVCTDYNYAESKNSGNYVSAGFTTVNANGYIKAFGYGNPDYDWLFIGSDTGGTSGGIIGDYHYVTANLNGYRVTLLGGGWRSGSDAGGFYWYLNSGVGHRGRIIGARLCYIPQK